MSEKSLADRNIAALAQAHEFLKLEMEGLKMKQSALEGQVAMYINRIQELEQKLTIMLISRGSGPTSK